VGGSPRSFTEFLQAETRKWAQVVKAAGVQAQ
jgi:tripartite-type tricarboxylate transporter receptor subunit TctC